jgi:antitoxin component YwqK of YwqJK toxin-antitoxin module
MKHVLIFIAFFFMLGCNTKMKTMSSVTGVNYNWLDSIKENSDTSYVKKYGTNKFATATYYINSKAAVTCQVMKDLSDSIRQIIVTKNNKRIFIAEYYGNGQLTAKLPLDTFGQYHGPATWFYENGYKESDGEYVHGFKKGEWKNYNQLGELTGKNEYDSNGNVTKIVKP